ncbi:phosphomannomutase [Aliarcobacter cryaerophilus]|uniref:phosphomannomutase n=1 Tax=Aliarcobacter cryaerophilus TaxID=28198 RepID=UPI0021B66767|nr:phosphomannomutase [Aliarcobacter cryaerophilus]MCT7487133.1 phosphomannomutase [Aliarcobacter cryaerophilus]MCT7491553.1 phosphomannomutase [Aliarcobacter cryaerophilus]
MKNIKEIIKQSGIKFGTSGARGLVVDFTPEVCTAFTQSFLDAMKKTFEFSKVAVAMDNRPSSSDMAATICGAIESYGFEVDFYGVLPTPALALQSMSDNIPSIMITGSHIPFDRNGIKFYTPDGEISKDDESEIVNNTNQIISIKSNLPEVNDIASINYMNRYANFFGSNCLSGLKITIYEHSSAGRELYGKLFTTLGAEVISLGRSDKFVPIDTEAVADIDKQRAKEWVKEYGFDAIFSTDGDGDRPLIADENGDWLRGDIVGLLTAQYLHIEALTVPVSCNTAIEKSNLFKVVKRTKIGSPYVIEAFEDLKGYKSFAGFEANGGFLLGSTLIQDEKKLDALPTRDALLPFIVLLSQVVKEKVSLSKLVQDLPKRFTSSDRIQEFPRENSLNLIEQGLSNPEVLLSSFCLEDLKVVDLNQTDGLRLTLNNQAIIHLRPSGNAPELRCYVETDSQEISDSLVKQVLSSVKEMTL